MKNSTTIYLKLSEAEDLIFKKFIHLPKERLTVNRAQQDLRVNVYLDENEIQEFDGYIPILVGMIDEYEIPEKEENLFKNHLQVPLGLFKTADRQYKDTINEELPFSETIPNIEEANQNFSRIRRGLLLLYKLGLDAEIEKEYRDEIYRFLNSVQKWTSFKMEFMKSVLEFEFFPIREINDGKFHPDEQMRFVWMGNYLFNENSSWNKGAKEELEAAKKWFLSFKNKEDIKTIHGAIKNIPEILTDEADFVIGYYFAASFYDQLDGGDNYYDGIRDILREYGLVSNHQTLLWSIFFQAIFKQDLDYLYFIKSLQEDQLILEKSILRKLAPVFDFSVQELTKKNIDEKLVLKEFIQLKDDEKIADPQFIGTEDLKTLFANNLSNANFMNFGYVVYERTSYTHLFPNRCSLKQGGFSLELINEPKNVTFYHREDDKKTVKWLKDLRLKTAPLNRIVHKKKKVLVHFLKSNTRNKSTLMDFYQDFLKEEGGSNIEEVVFVLLVDLSNEDLHSPDFAKYKSEIEEFYKNQLSQKVHLLVKNKRTQSDVEIKRNLKHLLGKYKIENIELVDENLTDEIRGWVLSVTNEYFLQTEQERSYYFYYS